MPGSAGSFGTGTPNIWQKSFPFITGTVMPAFGLSAGRWNGGALVSSASNVSTNSNDVVNNPYAYADYVIGLEQAAADKQYQNELNSAKLAMNFEASEAEKLRNWQTELRNSAYQASVADLKKAGLNPALALGSPAATPSGGMASGHVANSAKANMNVGSNVALALRELAVNSAVKIAQSAMFTIGDIIPG